MKRIGSVVAAMFVLQWNMWNIAFLGAQDSTQWPVVLQLSGMEKVRVERKEYRGVDGTPTRMDVYYPPDSLGPRKLPVVVLVNGVGLPGLPDWRGYRDWGKLVAISGMIGVTYESRPYEIRDSEALIDHLLLHADELGTDTSRIGIWTCSGNTLVGVPLALQQGREYVRCAVIYYGAPDEINSLRQDLSLFVVRAGLDEFRANRNIDRLIAKALDADIDFELVNYLSGHHAFDIADNTDRSREIIRTTLDFFRRHLIEKTARENRFVITAKNFYTMMRDGEVEKAKMVFLEKLKEMRSDRSNNPFYHREIVERGMNLTAQQLLQEGKTREATETLNLMLESYPLSPTAFLSAADGYRACGLTATAIEKAETAIRLLDKADTLSEDQKQSIRKTATEKIERWKKEKSRFSTGAWTNSTEWQREYLGQTAPGNIPEVFGPGLLSTERGEHSPAVFTPDRREVYWTPILENPRRTEIYFMRMEENRWTEPRPVVFTNGKDTDCIPAFSGDGKRMYFTSFRPLKEQEKSTGRHIWMVDRQGDDWGVPRPLLDISSGEEGTQASVARNGNLYFTSARPNGKGDYDIYVAKFVNGIYEKPENLGEPVNTTLGEFDPYIAPDESYLIFTGFEWKDSYGGADLYISFRTKDGLWTTPQNLGAKINSTARDIFPNISPDGKYLFFDSNRNGNEDIYWVDAGIIDELRPENLK